MPHWQLIAEDEHADNIRSVLRQREGVQTNPTPQTAHIVKTIHRTDIVDLSSIAIWLLFEAVILPLRSDYFALAQARSRATWLRALGRRAIASSCPKASMRKKEVVCWLVWCLSHATHKMWQFVGHRHMM